MFRDEITSYSKPPRPQHKTVPWILIVLVALVGLGAAHMAGLTEPFTTLARQSGLSCLRNLRTPANRLIGQWESDDDPMFRRVSYPARDKSDPGTGIYTADTGAGLRAVVYKVISQDRSGTSLEMAEYLPGSDLNCKVRYSLAKDGQSMTKEYDTSGGTRVSSHYRYVGPPLPSTP